MLFHTLPAGLTALCLATLIQTVESTCFHPNGSPSNDIPCNPDTSVSMCCSSPNACLGSGLCRSAPTNGTSADTDKFIRATCTDMTWTSSLCPPFCVPNSGPSNTTAFDLNLSQNQVHIRKCQSNQNQTFSLTSRFCCGFEDEKAQCCDTPEDVFELNLASTSADTPVALNVADGAPVPWTPLAPSPPSASTSSFATPNTPLIIASPGTSSDTSSSASLTTADPGTSDSSIPSTDPPSSVPSPTASASSTPASQKASSSTLAVAASAVGTALADSTSAGSNSNNGLGNSGKSANGDSRPDPWSPKHSSSQLSTGAVVGIGLGVSMATAGLVTISVYILARRRLYMKQKRKWEEQMKKAGGGADAGGTAPPGMVAVQAQTADGKPAVVMLPGGQGTSPVSLRSLKDMGWETRSAGDFSEIEKRLSATMMGAKETTELGVAAKAPVEPRGGRTATWFARHSIYEMG